MESSIKEDCGDEGGTYSSEEVEHGRLPYPERIVAHESVPQECESDVRYR